MKNVFKGVLAVAVIVTAGPDAEAADITVRQVAGTTYETTAITDYSTTGANMAGTRVDAVVRREGSATTVTYSGVWSSTGFFTGGVQWDSCTGFECLVDYDDFGLHVTGDTYTAGVWNLDFILDNAIYGDWGAWRLESLTFDGTTGNTVFDRLFGNTEGTPGSSLGRDFSGFNGYNGNITATYQDQVRLTSAPVVGDLFARFRLDFSSPTLGEGLNYRFTLDTDNAVTTLVPAPQDVPEPTSLVLLGAALVGAARRVRRRSA